MLLKCVMFSCFQYLLYFLDDDEKDEVPHLLFGNTLMKIGGKVCSINIGDLLIETETFQKWYYEKFFKKLFLHSKQDIVPTLNIDSDKLSKIEYKHPFLTMNNKERSLRICIFYIGTKQVSPVEVNCISFFHKMRKLFKTKFIIFTHFYVYIILL